MLRLIIILLGCLYVSMAIAQESRDYNWQLGLSSSPSNHISPQSIEMTFGDFGISIDTFFRKTGFYLLNASISNGHGELLVYSNGCEIRNSEHQPMAGTLHLNSGDIDQEWCADNFGYPISDGGLFLPFFGDSVLLLLHQRIKIESNPTKVISDSLFYTSLKMENEEYRLLEKSVPVVGGNLTNGNVEAVKAFKPGAWWVIQSKRESNEYFSILLDSAKVDTVITYFIGDTAIDGSASGQASFSPDGTKYARYSPRDDLFYFGFDRSSGLLYNFLKIHVADSGMIGGLAFSPNSRFLYVSSQFDLYQFDTWATDIGASKIHLGHYDGYVNPFPTVFYHMQNGPDCRIYINSSNSTKAWHIIHEPDLKGVDCHFEQHGFHFPVNNTFSMPNFPNYRLDISPACDPGLVTNLINIPAELKQLHLYPMPTNGPLWITLPTDWDLKGDVKVDVIDNLGLICFRKTFTNSNLTLPIGLEMLASGLYTVRVSSGQVWSTKQFVKTN